ncbi:ORF 3 [Maize associated rhabdovirus]|uniref:ORF 3 n=1 Tax=Maize associated rhabdovirus TaxID=2003308 RepID=A0A1X9Y2V7_9RHAB|nr:ORF 3 [Maize associated rhabdovirus]ARS22492.1 ORF 3 [Maize associated rhabdovirus]
MASLGKTIGGRPGKIKIRHQMICPTIELKTVPGMFSCLIPNFEYTSLMGITCKYTPLMCNSSYGEVKIIVRDVRMSANDILIEHSIPTNEKKVFLISGFECTLTEDCCPVALEIFQELEGLNFEAAVGILEIFPTFKASNYPHVGKVTYVKELSTIAGKKFGGMRIEYE